VLVQHAQGFLARNAEQPAATESEPEWEDAFSQFQKRVQHLTSAAHVDVRLLFPTNWPSEPPQVNVYWGKVYESLARARQNFHDIDVWFFLDSVTRERVIDVEQAAKNAAAIALLDQWLAEAELGVDPDESQRLVATKAGLEQDRTSGRKLFP
jgi:hypothetical protein